MREIAEHHDRAELEAFAAWLSATGVPCELVQHDRRWRLAVADDRAREAAIAFARFLHEPSHPARRALEAAVDTERAQARAGARPFVTWLLVGLAIAMSWYTDLGADRASFARFALADPAHARGGGPLVDVLRGEVWRLVTPIFLHLGLIHIIGNAQCFLVLGPPAERALGPARFAGLVLIVAIASNLAQGLLVGPAFGGLSGVVYGVFGYSWIRGLSDPSPWWRTARYNVAILLIWFALCFLPLGHVANTAHAAGLIVGCALGWLAGRRFRRA